MATAQHLDDRIPHLKELGIKPVLLSSVCGEPLCDMVHARVPCIAPSGIRFEARHWLRRRFSQGWQKKVAGLLISLPCLPFYLLEKLAVNLDSQWSWFVLAAIRGYGLCRKHRAKVIYSTGGAPSAHLAAAILNRWTGLPWIAEFQDPVVYPGLRRSRRAIRLYSWLEKLVGRRATRVVFLTEGARLRFAERTGADSNGIAIYPGSNPDKVPSVPWQKGNACRFAHVGTLAGTRNLKTFFQALSELFQESPTWLEKVEVHLYGHMDRAMRDLIRDFPHPGVVRDHGRLPRAEVLSAMAQSDVLLLVQNADPISEQTIPSKLYEYWLTGRPVLALTHGNRELTAMLNERGHFAAEVGQVTEIRRTLMQVLALWAQGLADWQPVRLSPVTVQAAVRKLANLPQAKSVDSNPPVPETHARS